MMMMASGIVLSHSEATVTATQQRQQSLQQAHRSHHISTMRKLPSKQTWLSIKDHLHLHVSKKAGLRRSSLRTASSVSRNSPSPPSLDIYILGLEKTLIVQDETIGNQIEEPQGKKVTPAPPRIAGALRRCKSPFYIVSDRTEAEASKAIADTWEFLASDFPPESPRLYGTSKSSNDVADAQPAKINALRQIANRVPENARIHYIDGDGETIKQVLADQSPRMQTWRVYWSRWEGGSHKHANDVDSGREDMEAFLAKGFSGTRAVAMELDDFVELVGTGVIMGYPYTHRAEEYGKRSSSND